MSIGGDNFTLLFDLLSALHYCFHSFLSSHVTYLVGGSMSEKLPVPSRSFVFCVFGMHVSIVWQLVLHFGFDQIALLT